MTREGDSPFCDTKHAACSQLVETPLEFEDEQITHIFLIKCQTELNIATSSGTQVEIEKHGAFRLLKDERASKELINLERSTSGYTNISRLETTNAAGEKILTTCGKDIRNIMD